MQERAYYNQGQKSHMYCMRILFSCEKALIVKVIKESLYFCKTEFISSFRNWIPFFIFISHTLTLQWRSTWLPLFCLGITHSHIRIRINFFLRTVRSSFCGLWGCGHKLRYCWELKQNMHFGNWRWLEWSTSSWSLKISIFLSLLPIPRSNYILLEKNTIWFIFSVTSQAEWRTFSINEKCQF